MRFKTPQTLSQALLRLGNIHGAEDPILAGVYCISVAGSGKELRPEVRSEMLRDMQIFEDYCARFVEICGLEKKAKRFLEKWLLSSDLQEPTGSRIDTYLGINMAFPTPEEKKAKLKLIKALREMLAKIRNGTAQKKELKAAAEQVKALYDEVKEKLNDPRRQAESVIQRRPIIPSL
jgi:hypothetical protein